MAFTDHLVDIADAIRAKDGSTAPIPFTDFSMRIRDIPSGGGGWVRPADRPPVPEIGEAEEVVYWLFGVQESSPNDFAITLSLAAGQQYRMEWGDGTQDDYNSGVKSEHLFNYADIPGEPNAQGYKWVWIKAYPLTGSFTSINVSVRHSTRPAGSASNIFVPQVFEWYIQAPEVTTIAFSPSAYTYFGFLDIFDYQGKNKIKSFSYFLQASNNLKVLNIDTSSGTSFSYFLFNCKNFNQPLNIDTSNGTNFSNFMQYCAGFNQPLNIDTSNGTNFSDFIGNCVIFNHPLNINTDNGIDFRGFISGCTNFNQPLVVNLQLTTLAIGTTFVGSNVKTLKSLRLLNMGTIHTALTISYSSLDVDALVALFGDLCDRTSTTTGTITITGVYGAARLTAEQRAIATEKNWTIVG